MPTNKYLGSKELVLVHSELLNAAKYRGVVTYQELAKLIGLPMTGGYMAGVLGKILEAISTAETQSGRPMLSSIAIGVGGKPGPRFWNLARELGKLTSEDEQSFWENECEAVYDTWKVTLREKPKE